MKASWTRKEKKWWPRSENDFMLKSILSFVAVLKHTTEKRRT